MNGPTWEQIRNGIFAGESGGDYNALFGFSNRDGGRFSHVKLTDMTVDQALQFASPSGEYGQHVKGQIGRVATPLGAYQVVGTTLAAAKKGLGLTGNERMTPETQDMIGKWILANQGTQAWAGYKGPQSSLPPGALPSDPQARNAAPLAVAYRSGKMTPEDAALYEQGVKEGLFPKVERAPQDDPANVYASIAMNRPRNQAPLVPLSAGQPVKSPIAFGAQPLAASPLRYPGI